MLPKRVGHPSRNRRIGSCNVPAGDGREGVPRGVRNDERRPSPPPGGTDVQRSAQYLSHFERVYGLAQGRTVEFHALARKRIGIAGGRSRTHA